MGVGERQIRLPVTANDDGTTTAEVVNEYALDLGGVTTDDGQSDLESVQGNPVVHDGNQSGQIRIFRRSQYRRMTSCRRPAIPLLTQPKVNNHSGSKKNRRYENQLELLKECDETELNQREVQIEDLISGTNTSRTFTKMLQHENMLETWNSYLDQEPIGRACRESKKSHVRNAAHNNQENQMQAKFDPELAFQGICRKLRSFIKQRHFPLGVMENLEEDLIGFFCNGQGEGKSGQEDSEMCYVSTPLDGFRRAVIHALCAYSNLRSHSIKCKEQQENAKNFAKQVCVQTSSNAPFQAPKPRLSEYIETKYHSPKKNLMMQQ